VTNNVFRSTLPIHVQFDLKVDDDLSLSLSICLSVSFVFVFVFVVTITFTFTFSLSLFLFLPSLLLLSHSLHSLFVVLQEKVKGIDKFDGKGYFPIERMRGRERVKESEGVKDGKIEKK